MNLRRIKHSLLRLSPEEKVIGLSGALVLFSTFMPWYSLVNIFEKKSLSQSGFSGDLGVIGFVVFLMVILALLVLVGEHLQFRIPYFGYTKEKILLFLMGQSTFLVLLDIAIYTKRSFEYTSAELRFGIYLAMIGTFLGFFAAFAQTQKLKKREVEEFFEHPEPEKKDKKPQLTEEEIFEDKTLFEKEMTPEEIIPDLEEEQIPKDDMIEEIEEHVAEEIIEDTEDTEPKEKVKTDQGGYFMKESKMEEGNEKSKNANSDEELSDGELEEEIMEEKEDSKKESEKDPENKKESSNLFGNFYEDE